MSRILRRPMFRGGRVDSRGSGITSGLSYEKGGRVGLANGGSYADALAQAEFNANRNNRLSYQSVVDRMNDYYNKLYTGVVNEFDLDMGLQIAPPMSTEDIAQSNLYESNQPEFQKEFLGEIPINPEVGKQGDLGKPIVESMPNHEISKIYLNLAEKIKSDYLLS